MTDQPFGIVNPQDILTVFHCQCQAYLNFGPRDEVDVLKDQCPECGQPVVIVEGVVQGVQVNPETGEPCGMYLSLGRSGEGFNLTPPIDPDMN